MTVFVENKQEFDFVKSILNEIIHSEKEVQIGGEIPFRANYLFKVFSDFDIIRTEIFYTKMFPFLKHVNCYIYTILPNSEDYYHRFFKRYSVIKFNEESKTSDILRLLHEAPKTSKADAMIDISDIVAIFPEDASWAMFFDREKEEGIIGSKFDFVLKEIWESLGM
jgi:hypothetical protein